MWITWEDTWGLRRGHKGYRTAMRGTRSNNRGTGKDIWESQKGQLMGIEGT